MFKIVCASVNAYPKCTMAWGPSYSTAVTSFLNGWAFHFINYSSKRCQNADFFHLTSLTMCPWLTFSSKFCSIRSASVCNLPMLISQAQLTRLVVRTAETVLPCVIKQRPFCIYKFLTLVFSLNWYICTEPAQRAAMLPTSPRLCQSSFFILNCSVPWWLLYILLWMLIRV